MSAPTLETVSSSATQTVSTEATAVKPIDWLHRIEATEFQQTNPDTWMSRVIDAEFPFDELIYSWSVRLADQEGFRLYLQVEFGKGDKLPWLYAGYWGVVDLVEKRTNPTFDRGHIAMDQLLLKQKANRYQFKIMDRGKKSLSTLPWMMVIATDNAPPPELAAKYAPSYGENLPAFRILDLPLRRQADSKGTPMPNRCQSAAVATAMEYFGRSIAIEDIVRYTNDPEYDCHVAYAFASSENLSGFVEFYLDDPGNLSGVGNGSSPNFITGADFDFEGNLYGVDYTGALYYLDSETGTMPFIGSTIGANDLCFDTSTSTWYVTSSNCLYTIDVSSGATTFVGSHGITNTMIDVTCDTEGNLYGYDVLWMGHSTLYSIDKSTGQATPIGDMGYGFVYAQDGAYDRDNGIFYVAG